MPFPSLVDYGTVNPGRLLTVDRIPEKLFDSDGIVTESHRLAF
jgi:hypothetical protein